MLVFLQFDTAISVFKLKETRKTFAFVLYCLKTFAFVSYFYVI